MEVLNLRGTGSISEVARESCKAETVHAVQAGLADAPATLILIAVFLRNFGALVLGVWSGVRSTCSAVLTPMFSAKYSVFSVMILIEIPIISN